MIKPLLILLASFCVSTVLVAQEGRLESEYKLDVPKDKVTPLWNFLNDNFGQETFELAGLSLSGQPSTEVFIDKYFDMPDGRFAAGEISLRHRKRFKDRVLLKQLVQLKTPYSEDKVIRNEINFEVDKAKSLQDPTRRHDLLQHIKSSDLERLSYHLAPLKLRPEALELSLKLMQTRNRIYISDSNGESIATITLDEVTLSRFPFTAYAEMELELNEVRYTQADTQEREKMTALNEILKSKLIDNFPNLKVDQRSKYRKMRELMAGSLAVSLYDNAVWFFFGAITLLAAGFFIKDQLL